MIVVGSNDEGNEDVDGGDGETIVDSGNDVDGDSSDKVMVMLMMVVSTLMVVMMPIEVMMKT